MGVEVACAAPGSSAISRVPPVACRALPCALCGQNARRSARQGAWSARQLPQSRAFSAAK
jgi:hypothetical protein